MPARPSDPLSSTDITNLIAIIQCFDEMPKVNIKKFMQMNNYTKSSADTVWVRLKGKLMSMADNNITFNGAGVTNAKTVRAKAPIIKAVSNDNDDDDEAGGPVKKRKRNSKANDSDDYAPAAQKGRARKQMVIKREEDEEDADEAEDAEDAMLAIKEVRGHLRNVDDEIDQVEAQMNAEMDAAGRTGTQVEAEDDEADGYGVKMEYGDDDA